MNVADWIILAVVALSSLTSLWRGFAREALSLLVWGAAFVLSMLLHESFAYLLEGYIEIAAIRKLIAIGVLFIATLVVGALLSRIVSILVKASGLTVADRVIGTVFGFVRGVIVVVVVSMFVPVITDIEQTSIWRDSVLLPQVVMLQEWSRHAGSASMQFLSGLLGK